MSPQVSATDDPAEIGVADLVLFAVKLWDTEDALRADPADGRARTPPSSRSRTGS